VSDESPSVRHAVVWALGELRATTAASELFTLAGADRHGAIRVEAARALLRVDRDRALSAAIDLVKSREPDVQAEALWILAELADPRAREEILILPEPRRNPERLSLLLALVRCGRPSRLRDLVDVADEWGLPESMLALAMIARSDASASLLDRLDAPIGPFLAPDTTPGSLAALGTRAAVTIAGDPALASLPRVRRPGVYNTAWRTLEQLMIDSRGDVGILIEKDGVRVVPRAKVISAWEERSRK
jgi:hypothetical protein